MNYNDFTHVVNEKEYGLDMSRAFPALMRKVYTWMTLALVITGLTAYGVATSPALLAAIFGSRIAFWGIVIAELALVFYVSARIQRLSLTAATAIFVLYSVLNGVTMASVFVIFTMTSVAHVFFITAGTFAAMSLIGYTTRTDLTKLGSLLLMGLVGLIIASVVNIFVASSGLSTILSYVGVLIFVGLTAYDTQKIKMMLLTAPDATEGAQKLALMGALSLYLDFINLFLYLLQIFGKRD